MSNIQDNLKMKGRLQVSLNGEVVRDIDNLVVTAGKNYVADRMKNNSSVMSHIISSFVTGQPCFLKCSFKRKNVQ